MTSALISLDRSAPFYVAGHRGLAGGAVWRHLDGAGFTNLVGRPSSDLDLRERDDVFAFFDKERPRYVVMAAARVGGILANSTRPVEFLSDNVRIQVNVLDAAHAYDVDRLLLLGSSCIYPKFAEQPIKESSLLTGLLEPTNDAYAIAKIAGVMHVQAMRRQYARRWISAMPTNLYGPGDNFDVDSSHVLAALIRRFDDAVRTGASTVTNWGTGAPRREFLHVDDLASAVLHVLENYDDPAPINIGTGKDLTIRELSDLVAQVAGYTGAVEWDASKPDGTPRKLLDVSRLQALGWRPGVELRAGVERAYDWYAAHRDSARR
ncbi:GDP-L-fucose synthase [Terrabacter tumescens]|uniref:GDP-L-fucose synthase n=1 Tax=Terrabacter tumescens TaxID=60443 RepID=A0ABQ2IFI0_9MICO|nr:GDP-L-fucose synthase [Terrabacter tumescens]GGN09628.1 GDP-L-fucose synthase [Terrabacter tumescens]